MKFIIFILLFFVVLFFLVPSILAGIIRFLLTKAGGNRTTYTSHYNSSNRNNTGEYTQFKRSETGTRDGAKKKVFDKNEGEYVSFEEIKKPTNEEKQ